MKSAFPRPDFHRERVGKHNRFDARFLQLIVAATADSLVRVEDTNDHFGDSMPDQEVSARFTRTPASVAGAWLQRRIDRRASDLFGAATSPHATSSA